MHVSIGHHELLNEHHTQAYTWAHTFIAFTFTFTQIITLNCLSLICAREFIYKHDKFTSSTPPPPGQRNSIYVHFQFIHSYWRTEIMWVSFRLCVLIVQFAAVSGCECVCCVRVDAKPNPTLIFWIQCTLQYANSYAHRQRGRESEKMRMSFRFY